MSDTFVGVAIAKAELVAPCRMVDALLLDGGAADANLLRTSFRHCSALPRNLATRALANLPEKRRIEPNIGGMIPAESRGKGTAD